MMKNEKLYSTGEFAKMAGVTIRTIRYYDKIGLLKPSLVLDNGYRRYCNQDFMTLQKILSLKELGFSLEEIFPIIQDENQQNFIQSLKFQESLIDQKIKHLNQLKESLKNTQKIIQQDDQAWGKVIELIRLSHVNDSIIEQYMNTKNIETRIYLHDHYSTNQQGWFPWLFQQIDFTHVYQLLEIGSGNGKLWEHNHYNLRNREFFLSDNSPGMVEELKKKLGNEYNYLILDCQSIPFKNKFFDTIIANHVLFYVQDLNQGLSEISRVLKDYGTFYCTSYSHLHMKEISDIVQAFDSRIVLSHDDLPHRFGLENGKQLLKPYFNHIELKKYDDHLLVNDAKPLVDYIMSCHGNQKEYLGHRLKEFHHYIEDLIKKNNGIYITKDCGLFICKK